LTLIVAGGGKVKILPSASPLWLYIYPDAVNGEKFSVVC